MNSLWRRGPVALLAAALAWSPEVNAAKIACVGDSITFGYGLSNPDSQSYPATLGFKLEEHTVQNFGVSGATLLKNGDKPYWNEASYGASGSFAPDVVVIMLGTNDAKPQNWSHESEFSSNYLELIEHYRSLGALVYVATPPPVYPPGAFDISPDVVAGDVVPAVRAIATEAGAPLVDVFTALSGKPENFPDTVHPDVTGAFIIAETVRLALEENGLGGAGPVAGAGGVGQGGRANAGRGGADAAGSTQGGAPSGGAGAGGPAGGETMTAGGPAGGSGAASGGAGAAGGSGGAGETTSGSSGRAGAGGSSGAPSGGASPAAGTGGAAGTAGKSGAGPAAAGASGSGAAPASTASDSGCGCRVAGSERLALPAWSALALAVASAFGRSVARRRGRLLAREHFAQSVGEQLPNARDAWRVPHGFVRRQPHG